MEKAAEGPAPLHEDGTVRFKFKTESSVYGEVYRMLKRRPNWKETTSAKFDLLLGERWDIAKLYARLGQDGVLQAVNHCRGTKDITMKALMVKTLRAYCDANGVSIDELLPETHLLIPGRDHDEERLALEQSMEKDPHSVWILKCTDSAHGTGILVSDDKREIYTYVDRYADDPVVKEKQQPQRGETIQEAMARAKRYRPSTWLAQRYVDRPLLFKGRKFDIRALVVLTHDYQAFWYKQWILRLCSEPYSLDNLKDKVVHITNHCVQTGAESYGSHEEGNELFTKDLQWYLMEEHGVQKGKELTRGLVLKMQNIVRHTLESIRENTEGPIGYRAFQVLGYDFIFSEDFGVRLLEINGSPACADRMKEEFARDLIDVAIDPMFGLDGGVGQPEFAPKDPGGRLEGEGPWEPIPWDWEARGARAREAGRVLAGDSGERHAAKIPMAEGTRLHNWNDPVSAVRYYGERTGPKREPDPILDKVVVPVRLQNMVKEKEAAKKKPHAFSGVRAPATKRTSRSSY